MWKEDRQGRHSQGGYNRKLGIVIAGSFTKQTSIYHPQRAGDTEEHEQSEQRPEGPKEMKKVFPRALTIQDLAQELAEVLLRSCASLCARVCGMCVRTYLHVHVCTHKYMHVHARYWRDDLGYLLSARCSPLELQCGVHDRVICKDCPV